MISFLIKLDSTFLRRQDYTPVFHTSEATVHLLETDVIGSLLNAGANVDNSPAQYTPVPLTAELGNNKIARHLRLLLAPWARLLDPEAESANRTFGMRGAGAERFAVSLIIYYINTGS